MLSETPIQEINMGKNRLSTIPDEFEKLKDSLNSVWCDDNEFYDFPMCLCSLTALTSLRMSSNMISSLPPPDALGNLLLLETLVIIECIYTHIYIGLILELTLNVVCFLVT